MAPKSDTRYLELSQMLSAPVVALIESDAMAAHTFREFLEEVAFEPAKGNIPAEAEGVMGSTGRNLGDLRYVSFSYERIDPNTNQPVTMVVKVPLLALIPIPLLQVSEATFDYSLKIATTLAESPGGAPDLLAPAPDADPGLPPPPVARRRLMGSLCASPPLAGNGGGSQRITENMKVHIKVRQADMPTGIETLMNVLANGINSVSVAGHKNKVQKEEES